ncbi:type 1 glutamine amidotransferase [Nocardioides sp. BP30]|uniref:type 1 glutamine amidotransferase n=1 Tax=Nocardioides sp. BP30 TaxID=3036374 RepID=UPI002468EDD9|nr:type 1 glutamine amidotransferase [Nocardioides sp. BP30]WGL50692.1 type 1 glutamine amidotransferase [Nocardioides sp. BP30]
MTRVLVVQHDPTCPPALFGTWLEEAGCRLDVRRAHLGEEQPSVRQYDGLLVLGGAMDADDDAGCPWLPATRDRIREAALLGAPTLGICLGHQLAAIALGGTVARREAGPQIGVLDVGWGCEVLLDPLVDRIAGEGRAVHWNQDVVVGLPPEAEVLARGPHGEVQAARLARTVWGVQFHPEVDGEVVATWTAVDAGGVHAAGLTAEELVSQTRAAAEELTDAWRPLAQAFARMARGRSAANGALWE